MDILEYFKDTFSVIDQQDVKEHLVEQVETWDKSVHRKLQIENPFYENQKSFEISKNDFTHSMHSFDAVINDYKNYLKLSDISNLRIDSKFWDNEISKIEDSRLLSDQSDSKNKKKKLAKKTKEMHKEIKLTRTLLLQKWEESLLKEYQKWEFQEIEKYRKAFLEKIEEWLKLLQEFQDLMDDLSLDTGLLFDLSKGNLTHQDLSQLKKWAEMISNNKGVKDLCDMLGRLRNIEKSTKQELVKTTTHIEHIVKDYSSKEEIVGIKIGNELEHIIPQELAVLGDPEISILFDKKFVEGELMCFDLEGTVKEEIEEEIESIKEVSEEEKLGPIILCIDTSGSMSGMPETIAKAITLYISTRAIKQKRDCFLINFSTSIETLDLSGKMGVKELVGFLGRSFHGGTDVAPALISALAKMKENKYNKSDVLVISDFVMASLPKELIESIEIAKSNKNSFYSLAIGNLFVGNYLEQVFNKQWVYNPSNTSVTQIRNITNDLMG